jgi:dTDP-4-dehydrorhamnose reductase
MTDYLNKYLKYKNKYLNLLQELSESNLVNKESDNNQLGGYQSNDDNQLGNEYSGDEYSGDEYSGDQLGGVPIQDVIHQNINEKTYIFLTGGTGTVGKALLEKFKNDSRYFIYYISRKCKEEEKKEEEKKEELNSICIDLDLSIDNNVKDFINFITNCIQYNKIDDKNKYIIINSAADKDSTHVKNTYKKMNPELDDTSSVNLYDHWSIKLANQLASLAEEKKIPFIHMSTVYVNRGNPTDPENQLNSLNYKWNNHLVTFDNVISKSIPNIKLGSTYIYGALKALTEKCIKDFNNQAIIIRLPVIVDENISTYEETSPSTIFANMLKANILEEKVIIMNNIHKRFPITAQNVANFIFNNIDKFVLKLDYPIINLPGHQCITKYEIAKRIKQDLKDLFKNLIVYEDRVIDPNLPLTEDMTIDNTLTYGEYTDIFNSIMIGIKNIYYKQVEP